MGWNPIPGYDLIVHVDGSARGNPGDAGFGVVVRNSEGRWILGACGYIGHATNLRAELAAILHGLQCLKDMNAQAPLSCIQTL